MSYSPQTGLVYLPMQDMALDFAHDPAFTRREGLNNILGRSSGCSRTIPRCGGPYGAASRLRFWPGTP